MVARLSCALVLCVLLSVLSEARGQQVTLVDHGSCFEAVVPPLPDLEAGEVRVFPAGAHPDSIVFEILATSCAGAGVYEFFLNDVSLGVVPANPGCDLTPLLQVFAVTDPVLLSAWNTGGENRLRFNLTGGTWVGWVRARLQQGPGAQDVCVWDHAGGNCDELDLMEATYPTGQALIDQELAFQDFVLVPELVVPFSGGVLPDVDIAALPAGDHVLSLVGGLSAPVSVTLEILATQCSFGDTFEFLLNDFPLTPAPVEPQALELCSCTPSLQSIQIADPLVLAAWDPAGRNRLQFLKNDHTPAVGNSTAWFRATFDGTTDSRTVCVFDAMGGNCDATDLCKGGFIGTSIDTTAAVGILGNVPADLQGAFTRSGQQWIGFTGSCPGVDPDPDPDVELGDAVVIWPPDGRPRDVSSSLGPVVLPASVRMFSNVPEDRRRSTDFRYEDGRVFVRADKGHARHGRYYLMVVTTDDGSEGRGVAAVVPSCRDRRWIEHLLEEAAAALETLPENLDDPLPHGLYELGERPPRDAGDDRGECRGRGPFFRGRR